jgi:fatty acid elongase 3
MSGKYLGLFDTEYVNSFAFTPGSIPLSTFSSVLSVILCYFILVLSTKQYIAARGKAFSFVSVSIVYNGCLSVLSLLLLVLHCSEVARLLSHHSLWSVLCDEAVEHTRGSHVFVYYVVYLTKYLELSDTLLLCLRGKQTPFIHLYHHAMTVFFAFLHLHEQTCIAWTMPILNLAVHVMLYAYFALHEMGVRVWWKRYLTLMQVTQFYLMFIPSMVALLPRIIFTISPSLPLAHACHGSWTGVGVGVPLLGVYLALFQSLYQQRYDSKTAATAQPLAASAATNGRKRVRADERADAVVLDEDVRSADMWGKDSIPYWRRNAVVTAAK